MIAARLRAALAATLVLAGCGGLAPLPEPGSTESPRSRDPLATEVGVRQAGGRLLAGPEARALLGKPVRYRWTGANGASGRTQVSADGRLRTYWDSGAVNGRIRFSETGYCSRYDGVRGNREDCYRIYRLGPDRYRVFREDGSYSGSIEIERP